MSEQKLNKALAIRAAEKPGLYASFTELHKRTQTPALMNGFERTYQANNAEDTRTFPPESQRVQLTTTVALEDMTEILTRLFNIAAATDWANCHAKADILVDGVVLLSQVPATYLLFLDKQLSDLHKFVSSIAELDPTVSWHFDETKGMHRSNKTEKVKTEKLQEALVMYPATEKHPAQTQLITKDVIIGVWSHIQYSGAIPTPQKKLLLARVQKLINAVKGALEHANTVLAPEQDIGSKIFGFLFPEQKSK